jgi:large subunit ribosomal protein L31
LSSLFRGTANVMGEILAAPVLAGAGTFQPGSTLKTHTSRAGRLVMKPGIHPDYHPVVFRDRSANFTFLTKSTLTSGNTIEWEDGNTYPVIDVEISSASHPFYTGKSRVVDTAGRVEQFRRRYGDNPSGRRS